VGVREDNAESSGIPRSCPTKSGASSGDDAEETLEMKEPDCTKVSEPVRLIVAKTRRFTEIAMDLAAEDVNWITNVKVRSNLKPDHDIHSFEGSTTGIKR